MTQPKNKKRIEANKTKKSKYPKRYIAIDSSFNLIKKSILFLWSNKKFWLMFLLVYVVFNIVFIRGLSSNINLTNVSSLKTEFNQVFKGSNSGLNTSFSIFLILIGSTTSATSSATNVFNFFLIIFSSMAIIWSFNQFKKLKKIKVRDAFYKGVAPVIPFLLIVLYIALQLVPMTIAAYLYNLASNNSIIGNSIGRYIWFILLVSVIFWSFYMLSSSIFSVYYVIYNQSYPVDAIKRARRLVKGIRMKVLGRLIVMIILLILAMIIIIIPSILIFNNSSSWVFYLLTILMIPIIHSYLYHLFLELKP